MERKRSNALDEKHHSIKEILRRPGDYLNPEITKELREIIQSSASKANEEAN